MAKKDPLGRQPRPRQGRKAPDHSDPALRTRAASVQVAAKAIWVDHPPQAEIIGKILTLRLSTLGVRGEPMDGLRLSEDSQAGKSAAAEHVKTVLAAEREAAGLPPNEYQVVIVGLDQKTHLKSVYQDILIQMGDPDWEDGKEKVLRQRIADFVRRLGVELLIVDECQHLKKGGDDVADVTDALKRLLDLGIVPLVFMGNLDSKAVFERNPQFAARLGLPLELTPLALPPPDFRGKLNARQKRDAVMFRNFVDGFDRALQSSGAVTQPPGLTQPHILTALATVSGGHVGRVARVLKVAAPHAAARGATTIEAYDLSCVTRAYAMKNKWVDHDPFSTVDGSADE